MTLQHAHPRTTTSLKHAVYSPRPRRTNVSSGHTTADATALPGSIALLSTYPPTQCGLATFTQALYGQLSKLPGRVGIVSVLDAPDDGAHASPGVVGYLVNGSTASAAETVRTLNGYGAVIVQHEYGIYGGRDGVDVLEVVEALTVPTIVVLHTVLEQPSDSQRRILNRLVAASDVVVTMTQTGRRRLEQGYGVDPEHIAVIPHGAIDHGQLSSAHPGATNPMHARPFVLTWGLLGPGKGIEWAIDAMASLTDLNPRYLVIGKTHPKVLEKDGERYRQSLVARASAAGVSDVVEIDSSYLSLAELADLVERADVVLLPYDSPDQVTSGVLIEAVAAGRPVVSTAFPHAVELLSGGAGLLVPQRDPVAMAAALRRVISEPGLARQMAATAAGQAPELAWSAVARRYRDVAAGLGAALPTSALPATMATAS
ncbi:MAG: glycosyltransferase [Terrimesophilobacter sp.]